ncbi:MAG: hypothetical protein CR986_07475 [Ignavibacteriae bacterium]|nr:MAG: hypothetical protein CR986_07475 [Ignavibacteriota bacterium]
MNCEQIPTETIETNSANYAVIEIEAPDTFNFSPANNKMSTSITLRNYELAKKVSFDILLEDGSEFISQNNQMLLENTNKGIFIGSFQPDTNLLSGTYLINYFVEDAATEVNNVSKVGSTKFYFITDSKNKPPVISNLNIPDEIEREVSFVFTVKAEDPNGLADIEQVYFKLKRPDGTVVYSNSTTKNELFPMFDNGDISGSGDETKGDGIFSLKNEFGKTSQVGNWMFEFGAVDKSGEQSNKLTHTLKVK